MTRELSYKQLKRTYDHHDLNFTTTSEIEPYNGIVGQQRAHKAIQFGLNIKEKGYHLFLSGMSGVGKTAFAIQMAQEKAKTEKVPDDVCYVYNFNEPTEPQAMLLPPGVGIQLKKDMEALLDQLCIELPKLSTSKDFEATKERLMKKYEKERDLLIVEVTEKARVNQFGVKTTSTGIYFMPIIDDEMITEEQYDALSEEEKVSLIASSEQVQAEAQEIMRKIKDMEKDVKKNLKDVEYSQYLYIVGHHVGILLLKYEKDEQIFAYLNRVKEDILDNIDDFIEEEQEESLQTILPWYSKKTTEDTFNKYRINVLVDHGKTAGAPVIVDYTPSYSNLIGEIEYDSEFGNLSTDFMKIKPGVLHKANGGYLILQAHDVVSNVYSWETLKRVLNAGEFRVEPLKEFSTGLVVSCIKPQTIPLNIKIILVGSPFYYELLNYYDEHFQNLFKIKAEFDYEMTSNEENLPKFLGFLKKYLTEKKRKDMGVPVVQRILEYAQRLSGSQKKLTSHLEDIVQILDEAFEWAAQEGKEVLTEAALQHAIEEKDFRNSIYQSKLAEYIEENVIMINTEGRRIGQINGLSVLDMGDYAFGMPSKITATTHVGKAGVINIEKEVDMSGRIHDKGVQVLSGFIGQHYAQEFPLALSCRICFEQNYNGVDGDSASSTELYAILSNLSNVPINQYIAVTGSINQFGDIQPIGGVTYKIEGFFDLCKRRGLSGKEGVVIPQQNVTDLVLKDEVIEAVKKGQFHIYPIAHVNEGIEILMNTKAGVLNEKGKFPADSIHGKAYKKLKDYHKASL